jgi:membrane protease YdiL (CAAX protease family)
MTAARVDPLRIALQVGLYVFFFIIFLGILVWLGVGQWLGIFAGSVLATFVPAVLTNLLTLRIYEGRNLSDIGLLHNRAAAWNLGMGFAGGVLSAALVLSAPLLTKAATMQSAPLDDTSWRVFLYVPVILLLGAAGEEILFRGYGFQVLLRNVGPFATILPVGILFALLHATNPHASTIGLVNTAGFGVLFGYAFLRSRDMWLPIGLHFGWNLTLPLFGVSVSGITMKLTGYQLKWHAGTLWSGGEYGPEASILTSAVLFALAVFVWKAPVHRQPNRLLDEPVEN